MPECLEMCDLHGLLADVLPSYPYSGLMIYEYNRALKHSEFKFNFRYDAEVIRTCHALADRWMKVRNTSFHSPIY